MHRPALTPQTPQRRRSPEDGVGLLTRLYVTHLWVDREMEKVGRGGEKEAEEQQVGERGEAGGPEVGCVDQHLVSSCLVLEYGDEVLTITAQ